MAYCLGTLVELLDQILHPDHYHYHPKWILDPEKIPQIQSLFGKASFLRDFLADSSLVTQAGIETLEDTIRFAAEIAEDVLESYISSRIMSGPWDQCFIMSPPDLSEVIEVFDAVTAKIVKMADASQRKTDRTSPHVSSRRNPKTNNVLVGVTECLNLLKGRLTARSSGFEIIPIVGMGGIGKTTLARKLYDEYASNKSHFDICAWATISQDYDQRGVLRTILGCMKGVPTSKLQQGNEELKVTLHKELFSRRYLIVLDDIWSSDVWDDLCKYFPNDNRGSRVILTTRENGLADFVGSKRHELHPLNKNDSWELFEKIVYGGEKCPTELDKVSRKIANNCRGLPLAVQVIGGFLSRAERSKDLWEQVGQDISSFIAKEDEQFAGIFSWSYAYLPHYLKPCFLYIGAFPEDQMIRASTLIKSWVAEGFLNPRKVENPEEVAQIYLKALVDRNLIFVRERKFGGDVKSYGIHDLLRDLCLRKAREKSFIHAKKLELGNLPPADLALCPRRICVSWPQQNFHDFSGSLRLMPLVRSFRLVGKVEESVLPEGCFEFSLLRVLDVSEILFSEFPTDILELVNLRYLALFCGCAELPEDIFLLRNVQILIMKFRQFSWVHFPVEIFHIPTLRHVKLVRIISASWVPPDEVPSFPVQENLQSLSMIPVRTLVQMLGNFPNLKKLGIDGEGEDTSISMVDLTCFHKLETVRIRDFCSDLILPHTIKKLTLDHVQDLSWTFISTIGALPNLEVLKFDVCFFESRTWAPSEGEFCKLQYLQLRDVHLEDWIADETHFPQLSHLVIVMCHILKEIPLELGGIATLEIMEVHDCPPSVFDSARSIHEQQCDFGNDLLQLRLGIPFSYD